MKKNTVRSFLAQIPLIARIGALYLFAAAFVATAVVVSPRPAPVVYADTTPVVLQQEAAQVAEEKPEIQGMPTHLSVERLGVDLVVQPGTYDPVTKEWTLTHTEAFFATMSEEPGTKPGTTFIYGHNRKSAFGPLANVQVGDTVKLTLEDGTVLTYVYARDVKVTPETTNIIYEKSDFPQLVLMTCDGLFSEARRVMYFTLQEAA